jgi:hypothetical protein
MLTLDITLFADGTLTYDRAYDGHKNDRFLLMVNGRERRTVTHTAGHSWVTDSTLLRKGRNRISWVIKTATYVPPVTRNGVTVSTTPPTVSRSFRLCRFSIQNVNTFPGGTVGLRGAPVYIDLDATGTATFTGRRGARGQVSLRTNSTLGYKAKPAMASMNGAASVTFTLRSNTNAQCAMLGESLFGQTGAVSFSHAANDCPIEVNSTGALTVAVPFNTPQTVTSLIRNLQSVSLTMNTPVFIKGLPMMPKYQNTQVTNISTAGGYVYTDPVSPTSINHVYPIAAPKYRWVATDIAGADNAQVLTWPEHGGTGPSWVSTTAYAPTINPHERYSDLTGTYTTYSRTVRFYSDNLDHMWLTMPANAFPTTVTNVTPFQPYSWVIVAMVHPMFAEEPNVILDAFLNGATPTDYSEQIEMDDVDIDVNDGTGGWRSTIRLQNEHAWLQSNNTTALYGRFVHNYKPVVYTGVFNGASSSLTGWGTNYMQKMSGSVGAGSNYQQGFVLGRRTNHYWRRNSSNMTVFEVAFYNRAISATETMVLSQYLMGVYKFDSYQ